MTEAMRGSEASRTFLPAAGRDLFLPLYDPLTKLLGADGVRKTLLDQAALRPNERALEVGCGTGSLTVLVKRRHADVEMVGLDPDRKALERAERKAQRAKVAIKFDRGFSDELPYPDASFDCVLSCLMFHHLEDDEKDSTLREIRRVLRPDGRLEMVDFVHPTSGGHGRLVRWLHSHERLRDSSDADIVKRLNDAGHGRAACVGNGSLLVGRVAYFRAFASR